MYVPLTVTVTLYTGVLLQIIHESIHDEVVDGLVKAYAQVKIGDPLDGQYFSMFDSCTYGTTLQL